MNVYLADVMGAWGSCPDMPDVKAKLLERADQVLPGGRDHREPLTEEQLEAFGLRCVLHPVSPVLSHWTFPVAHDGGTP